MLEKNILSRLILVFMLTFVIGISGCSYVPWIGDEGEDDLTFEDDLGDEGFADNEDDTSEDSSDDFFDDEPSAPAEENDEFADLEQETAEGEIKGEVESLQSKQEALESKIAELEEIIQTMEPKVDDSQERLDSGLGGSGDLEPDVNELKAQVARLEEDITRLNSSKRSSSPRRTSRRASAGTPAAYDRALDAYRQGKYDESILLFQDFSSGRPPQDLKDNIHFWIGNNYVKLGMFDDAISQFDKVIDEYPRGNKVHDSRYMLGVSYFKKGDKGRALDILETALKYNPPSDTRKKIESQLLAIQ
jgi:TolA-binding protein